MLLRVIRSEVVSWIRVKVSTQATSHVRIFNGETKANYACCTETKFKAFVCVDVSVQAQRKNQARAVQAIGHALLDTINL